MRASELPRKDDPRHRRTVFLSMAEFCKNRPLPNSTPRNTTFYDCSIHLSNALLSRPEPGRACLVIDEVGSIGNLARPEHPRFIGARERRLSMAGESTEGASWALQRGRPQLDVKQFPRTGLNRRRMPVGNQACNRLRFNPMQANTAIKCNKADGSGTAVSVNELGLNEPPDPRAAASRLPVENVVKSPSSIE
ncbi:hypothetical protein Mal65_29220 [Crateriforma conspicua]|nr:hypothetical protein Mal65_29220 [Crateriforma conspicua]